MVLASLPKHRPTAHDKKRLGQHHKPSKHYAKTYWPYLPMLLVVLSGFILNMTWNVGRSVLGYATNVGVSSLLQETNIQRSQNSQGALSLNSQLSQAAQAKANDMAARNYWSHVSPDGMQPWTFISNAGYDYTSAGENLAYGFDSSSAAVAGWMNSPSHRANLLNSGFSEVGFGMANAANYQDAGEQTIIVAMYASPQKAAAPQTAQTGVAPPKPAPQTAPAPTPAAEAQEQPVQEAIQPTDEDNEPSGSTETTNLVPIAQTLPATEVSRIDVLTNGNAQWAALVVSVLAAVSILAILFSHIKMWHKFLRRGERYIIRHPFFDAFVLAIVVVGFVLTRTSGFIH
jgi:cysteine-rich secretory family protein